MKQLLLALVFLQVSFVCAQKQLIDQQGSIRFQASEGTFVPVKALNTSASVIIDLESGEIASMALVKEFVFKNALMQEHFNENYMESDRFPKLVFQGKIRDFDHKHLQNAPRRFKAIGTIQVHGVSKQIEILVELSNKEGVIYLSGNFVLKPEDFNIKIPKIVRYKIAEKVFINLDFKLM